jgi:hypothetical protein
MPATTHDLSDLTAALCRHMTHTLVCYTVINAAQLITILALFRFLGDR